MLVSLVHPVAILCILSLCLLLVVVTIWWKHIEYGSCYGFVCTNIISVCFHHVVDGSALSTSIVFVLL